MESKEHPDGAICLDLRLGAPSLPGGGDDHRIGREEASFECEHCSRKFLSRKALCGHQNAHRPGRAPVKHERRSYVAATQPAPPVVVHPWLHTSGEQPWRAYPAFPPGTSTLPTRDRDHHDGEAAAAQELDLSLKL